MFRIRIDTIFLVATCLLVGAVFGILMPPYFSKYGGEFIVFALTACVLVLAVVLFFALFGKQLLSKMSGVAANQIDDLATPIGGVIKGFVDGEMNKAGNDLQTLTRILFAKYAWVSTRKFIMVSSLGIVATIGGLSTTLLLLQQNSLLQQQNAKIDSQNTLFSTETQLLEQQTKLLNQQMILTERSTLSETTVAVRELFNEVAIIAQNERQLTNAETIVAPLFL